MKIVTLNLRGAGSSAKQKRVKRLIVKKGFDICFFQERKRSDIDIGTISRLCGGDDFDWVAQSSIGLSGGILIVWRKGSLSFLFSFSNPGYIGCAVQVDSRLVYLVNVQVVQ